MKRKPFLNLVNGYESDKSGGVKSSRKKRFFSRSYSGSVTGGGGSVLRRSVRLGNKLTEVFSFTQSNAYGAGLLGYGITTFLAYFLIYYFDIPLENGSYSAVIGTVAIVLGLPLVASRKPIGIMLQDNRVLDFLFFEFFCIKRPHFSEKARAIPLSVVTSIGVFLGLLGALVPSWTVAVSIGGAVVIFVALLSPECAFIISLMALPYLSVIPYSEIAFSILIGLTVISFVRKVVCGKRVIFFEQYDLLLILLAAAFLISGIFMKGSESFVSSVTMLVMALGYILAGNLIANRRLADCALNAVVISSIPASVYSVSLFVADILRGEVSLKNLAIDSTFSSGGECAMFMLCAVIFSVALAKQASGKLSAIYSAAAVLCAFALCLTGELFAVLALLIGFGGYFIFKAGGASLLLVIILAAVPYLYVALPPALTQTIAANISGAESGSELIELWSASVKVFLENPMFGAGIGEESFAEEMSSQGIVGYGDSHNTFIELGLEAGAIALLAFLLILLVRIRHRYNYRSYLKETDLDGTEAFIEVCLLSFVSFGATDYIWSDGASFYLFWCVFGIGSAVLRLAKKEVDDRTLYYEDTRDVDYSAIDIHLR